VQINIEGTTTANQGSLEQLTINSAGTAANTLTVGTTDYDGTSSTSSTGYASAAGITKFTVTGDQALTLKVDHATISTKTLEKTGTGALTLNINRGTATTPVTSLAQAAGYSNLVLRGEGDVNVSGIANGATVTIVDSFTGNNADSLSVKGAATGTNDSLTLVLDHKTDATNISFGNAAFAVNDIETINIVSKGGDSTGHTLGDTSTASYDRNAAKDDQPQWRHQAHAQSRHQHQVRDPEHRRYGQARHRLRRYGHCWLRLGQKRHRQQHLHVRFDAESVANRAGYRHEHRRNAVDHHRLWR